MSHGDGHSNHHHGRRGQDQRRHDLLHPATRMLATTAASVALAQYQRSLQESFFQPHHEGQYYYYYNPHDDPYAEESKFMGIIPWTLRLIKLCIYGMAIVASSATCYGVFYWAVMPGSYASRPLFFDYTGTVPYPHDNVTNAVPPPNQHQQQQQSCSSHQMATVSNDPALVSCSTAPSSSGSTVPSVYSPWATVDLFVREQAVVWGVETLHPEALPPQETRQRILPPSQPYYVQVHLTLPETRHNQQVGMFGVAVDLLSDASLSLNQETTLRLASSVRPARLPHESDWVALARKTFWILPLILGGMPESRVLVIPSFRHIVESQQYPLRHVVVRIVHQPRTYLSSSSSSSSSSQTGGQHSSPTAGSTAQTTGVPPVVLSPVEVIRGEVRIGKELNAWQDVLKEWFYTCYLLGTVIFISLHLATWGVLEYYWNQPKENTQYMGEQQQQQPYMDPSFAFDMEQDDDDGFESLGGENGNDHESDENIFDNAFSNNNGDNRTGSDDSFGDSGNSDDWEECTPDASEAQNSELDADNLWNGPPRERSSNSSARVVTGNHREQRKSAAPPHRSADLPRDTGAATQPRFAVRMPDPEQSLRSVPQGRTKAKAEEGRGHGKQKRRQVPAKAVAHEKTISGSVDNTEEDSFMDCLEDLGTSTNVSTSAKLVTAFKSDRPHAADLKLKTNVATALSSCPIPDPTELTNVTSSADESNAKGYAIRPSLLPLAESHQRMLKRPPEVVESAWNEESLCEAVLKVPEAQVLDSFLSDLINPFVR